MFQYGRYVIWLCCLISLPACNSNPPVSKPASKPDTQDAGSTVATATPPTDSPQQSPPPPETSHLESQTVLHENALSKETSPYLLMHAHNPVNWYAWNDETLALAKASGKPIFLSIGYSSCHWCHVMERESFLDQEIADFLNENFICIKVDREERPDVDEIYMNALQVIRSGGGGWPLSMFMTPEAKPFFGGTYWPARDGDRGASMGFLTIIQKVKEAYQDNREAIIQDSELVSERTRELLAGLEPAAGLPIQAAWPANTIENLGASFDSRFGGFGYNALNPNRPKFPEPSNLFFLLDYLQQSSDATEESRDQASKFLVKTCEGMLKGGIYDHLGGGFHRYSVDRFWHIPHFEKMLYDNGQLASVYAETFQLTGQEEFKNVANGILEFVSRELAAPGGGFYASLDAESEGIEGKFYRWDLEEIKSALTVQEYELFSKLYRLDEPPNFEEEFYAPQLKLLMSENAIARELTLAELESQLTPIRKKLFDIRAKRKRPLLDTKILAAWNGLMIRGYADAGRIFENSDHIKTAELAADFILEKMVSADGRLYRTYTDGKARLNAYLIDYACVIDGLISLHRANGNQKWLEAANRLQKTQDDLFWDEKGGYFYTSKDHEQLIARSKRASDGAMPGGNSVAAANLYYLGTALKQDAYLKQSEQTVLAASAILTRAPHAVPRLVITASKFAE
ncbi:thioredoxin domain-containing protein [Mariniblastus sp.]|nr:thioredoxin domain-containing protein [Mariniblastus sp.]